MPATSRVIPANEYRRERWRNQLGWTREICRNGDGDALAFIIGAEIYDHLEKVVDRFEDVANRINGVLVEHL